MFKYIFIIFWGSLETRPLADTYTLLPYVYSSYSSGAVGVANPGGSRLCQHGTDALGSARRARLARRVRGSHAAGGRAARLRSAPLRRRYTLHERTKQQETKLLTELSTMQNP